MSSASASPARPVFFVSDGTAITAETLGSALLLNFPQVAIERHTIPFTDSVEAAHDALALIRQTVAHRPDAVVFATLKDPELLSIVSTAPASVIDLLAGHLSTLEGVFGVPASAHLGTAHSLGDLDRYHARMWAIEYAIEHDDGQSVRALDRAEVLIIAPSRCGKTPTTMFLALQHGVVAANYPLTEDDLPSEDLPRPLAPFAGRCFGLTSTPQRLSQLRTARRPGSRYAALEQCTRELRWAEALYRRHGIPSLSSADRSVEEMAAVILRTMTGRGTRAPGTDSS